MSTPEIHTRTVGFTRIKDHTVFKNGNLFAQLKDVPPDVFFEHCYRMLKTDYPKFHKMDNLCKLGFLGTDILLSGNELNAKYNPYEIGVILSNKNASLDTDIRHHRQIQSGPASPAVFVYSLPNIVIGEVCIRNNIKGENTFFIEKEFNIEKQVDYINLLFNSGVLKACIGGWVEFNNGTYDSFLYLAEISSDNAGDPFNSEHIKKLYTIEHG